MTVAFCPFMSVCEGIGSVAALGLQRWEGALNRFGVSLEDFLRTLGVAPDLDVRVPAPRLAAGLEAIAAVQESPHFGIELACALPIGVFGAFDYRWSASATLFQAMIRSVEQFAQFTDAVQLELHVDADLARLVQTRSEVPPILMEHFSAMFAIRIRHVSEGEFRFTSVRFAHPCPSPESKAAIDAFFGVDVEFDAPTTELVFPGELLHRRLVTADPGLLQLLREHPASCELVKQPPDTLLARVREEVALCLEEGRPVRLGSVAKSVGVSVRTLQRKLGERETSLTALVDERRRGLAIELLSSKEMPIAQVAAQVGFANASALSRAFRRWTGSSPHGYRNAS